MPYIQSAIFFYAYKRLGQVSPEPRVSFAFFLILIELIAIQHNKREVTGLVPQYIYFCLYDHSYLKQKPFLLFDQTSNSCAVNGQFEVCINFRRQTLSIVSSMANQTALLSIMNFLDYAQKLKDRQTDR